MYIQRILRNAFLAELLLFLMVANCAPNRPREDVGQVPGDPASHHHLHEQHHQASVSRSSKKTPGAGSSFILSAGHQRKHRLSTACSGLAVISGNANGDLLRFLPGGGVDARGDPSDPDTDVRLISEQSKFGIVRIYSQSRKRYLCFNKKGKLVTKKNPSPSETLCQFHDKLVQGGMRRLISAYHPKQSQAPSASSLAHLPIALHHMSAPHAAHHKTHEIDLDAWQVGFGRSGEPLKGSAWKSSKWSQCYDLVYHDETVRSAVHHAPVDENDMRQIFQQMKFGSLAPTPTTPPQQHQQQPDVPKGTSSKSNQLNSKPNKSSSSANNKSAGRGNKSASGKHGAQKWEPTAATAAAAAAAAAATAKQGVHLGAKRSKVTGGGGKGKQTKVRTTSEHAHTTQASLPQSEERGVGEVQHQERRANDVSFDVLLAQTEQLLAQAAALPATVAASLVPDDEAVPVVEYSHRDPAPAAAADAPPTHRSTFILLDSGGWQEVVLDEQPESQEPARQEDDISA